MKVAMQHGGTEVSLKKLRRDGEMNFEVTRKFARSRTSPEQ